MRGGAIAGVLAVCLLAGCISRHVGAVEREASWQTGVTTREEVVRAWGNPAKTHGDTWIWTDGKLIGSKLKAAYYGIGLTLSSSRRSTCEHRLTFDAAGVLLKMERVESVPGGARWTLNPFD